MSVEKLKKLISKLRQVESALLNEADRMMFRHDKELVDINKKQLEAGEDSIDKKLEYKKTRKGILNASKAYTKAYDKYKSARGGQTNHVDLKLSGDFHDSIRLTSKKNNEFKFLSEDEKYIYLETFYGEDILGIQETNLEIITKDKFEPELNKFLDKYIKA